jgi:hypothetical protein
MQDVLQIGSASLAAASSTGMGVATEETMKTMKGHSASKKQEQAVK